MYFPLLVMSAVKISVSLWLCCGQDKQDSGMDQLYTGSGNDDTVQFSITCVLAFITTVSLCLDNN